MKKSKILLACALFAAALSFVACKDPAAGTDPTEQTSDPKTGTDADAEADNFEAKVTLALKNKTGDEDMTDAESVALGSFSAPFAFVSQTDLEAVKVGARVYFTAEVAEGGQFRVQNWSWADLVTCIYKVSDNTKIDGEADDGQLKYTVSGDFYFVVTEDAKVKMAQAIEIHGANATLSKFAYANPKNN